MTFSQRLTLQTGADAQDLSGLVCDCNYSPYAMCACSKVEALKGFHLNAQPTCFNTCIMQCQSRPGCGGGGGGGGETPPVQLRTSVVLQCVTSALLSDDLIGRAALFALMKAFALYLVGFQRIHVVFLSHCCLLLKRCRAQADK